MTSNGLLRLRNDGESDRVERGISWPSVNRSIDPSDDTDLLGPLLRSNGSNEYDLLLLLLDLRDDGEYDRPSS